ncbi:double-stranded RNA-binding protein 3-like isoform X2 [Chenopodium quinoa]|nr:double-stranded RNA-binding protein 3-like isoform X2 [Chenopodium quinoa]
MSSQQLKQQKALAHFASSPLPLRKFASSSSPLPQTSVPLRLDMGIPEHLLYKNRLLEFAQREVIAFPVYHTINEGGPPHTPQYRSTVEVDGDAYTCLNSFSTRKAAEQDAARLALEGITKKIKERVSEKTTDGCFPPIHQDKIFCKSILHEFAVRMNKERPTHDTVRVESIVPVFVSSLVFNGVKYVGQPTANKKEAEQLVARAAILSILDNSGEGVHLSEIVKSKAKSISAVDYSLHAIDPISRTRL